MKFITGLLSLILSLSLKAETIHLMDFPLSEGKNYSYTVNAENKCSFKGVDHVDHPKADFQLSGLSNKLNEWQKKINLTPENVFIQEDFISFNLQGADNILFEFKLDKKTCKVDKSFIMDKKKQNFETLEVEYTNPLGSPVVKKVSVDHKTDLYPWAFHGGFPSYELEVGFGGEVHSNYRLRDQRRFHKSDPAIGPVGLFSFRYGPLFVNKNGAGSLVFSYMDISLLALAVLEGENYQGGNLKERKEGVFMGGILNWHFIEFTYYNDFFDTKGMQYKLNLSPKLYYKTEWRFKPQLFAQYWSDKYVDYYFGVTKEEANTSGLTEYKGKSTMNYGSALEVMHFMGAWTFVTEIQAKFFGNKVYNSPTTIKKEELRLTSGMLYKFF